MPLYEYLRQQEIDKHQFEAESRSWLICEVNWLRTQGVWARPQAETELAREACRVRVQVLCPPVRTIYIHIVFTQCIQDESQIEGRTIDSAESIHYDVSFFIFNCCFFNNRTHLLVDYSLFRFPSRCNCVFMNKVDGFPASALQNFTASLILGFWPLTYAIQFIVSYHLITFVVRYPLL